MFNVPHAKQIYKSTATAIDRANEQAAEPNKLYDDAIEKFEMTERWPAGHTVRLLDGYIRGKRSVVSLRNAGGWIKLIIIVNGRTQYSSEFVVGYYDVKERKWTQSRSCTLADFNRWQLKCSTEISRLEDRRAI